MQEALGKIH